MKNIIALYKKCKKSVSNLFFVIIKAGLIKLFYNKFLLVHQNVLIRGLRNIESKSKIEIGIGYNGFMMKSDKTYLNIQGKLIIAGEYQIGRGCRFDIGEKGVVHIGNGGYINSNCLIIVQHNLTIGDNCAISWDCQFLDEDFHEIEYDSKLIKANSIIIGNHVWIGCGVKIYRGTTVPDSCVITSNSIVKGKFSLPNAIIGGNPAKIIKENIVWC